MDYEKYTGSTQYKKMVGEALVINSYGQAHSFFGTDHEYVSIEVGRWNDDVEWWAKLLSCGELFGINWLKYMAGMLKQVRNHLLLNNQHHTDQK